jgi:hypothetical protein
VKLKLEDGQDYDRSSVQAAVVAPQNMQVRHDLLCKACIDRGLVLSAKVKILQ